MPKPVEYNATVSEWHPLSDSLAIFRVKQDAPMATFLPGQYTVLGLNSGDGSVSRAYSIASAPESIASDGLEFYIRKVGEPRSEMPLTHLLFNLKPGDRIWSGLKPRGKFTLNDCCGGEADPRLKILVAAGTGLAPFTSMVKSAYLRKGTVPKDFAIVHGVSHAYDLGYRKELETLMNGGPHERYVPTISRPLADWHGAQGRVESHFEPEKLLALESRLGVGAGFVRPENAVVFICGLHGTIHNTLLSLLDRGFVPEDRKLRRALWIPESTHASIFFEQYDTEPIFDIKDEALCASLRARLERAGVHLEEPPPLDAAPAAP